MTYPSLNHPQHLYFVTATTCGWKKILSESAYANIVLGSLKWLRKEGRILLFAFVVMPSHVHTLLKPTDLPIGKVLQQFGSYTAHEILKQLKRENQVSLLQFFHEQHRKPGDQHSIWQDIQAQNIFTQDFLSQKLDYIHSNPCREKWKLVEDRADYRYSSACFYDRGQTSLIEVDDLRQWLVEG